MVGKEYVFAAAPMLAAAIWGGMYVVSKWGFSVIPPLTLGFLRVAIGGVVLYAVVRRRGRTVDPADYRQFLLLGGWVAATIATQFLGTDLTNASQGSLLTVLTPVFTVALGAAILGERVTGRKAVGMTIAFGGTLLVVAGRYDVTAIAAGNAAGVGMLVLASLCWAGYTVWGVPVVRKYGALTATTYATLAATPMLAVPAAIELWVTRPPLASVTSLPVLAAVAYLGVAATAAAWYLWYKGLEYVPAGTVAVFFFAQPIVGTALGAALLGETVGVGFLIGGLLMAVGVWVVSHERGTESHSPDGVPD